MRSPLSVLSRRPSTNTGALGSSKVPGREMPRLACLDSPGPLTIAHHGHAHLFDPPMLFLPYRHLLPKISLDLVRHILKESAGGAPAAGAGRNLRSEAANSQRLQDLLRNDHFLSPVPIW